MLLGDMNDEYETIVKRNVCNYHKKHPENKSWAGCACSTTYIRRKKKDGTKSKVA